MPESQRPVGDQRAEKAGDLDQEHQQDCPTRITAAGAEGPAYGQWSRSSSERGALKFSSAPFRFGQLSCLRSLLRTAVAPRYSTNLVPSPPFTRRRLARLSMGPSGPHSWHHRFLKTETAHRLVCPTPVSTRHHKPRGDTMWLPVMKRWKAVCTTLVLTAVSAASFLHAQARSESDPLVTPEGLVAAIYDMVSFEGGSVPDWDKVRSLFIPEAVVVLRTSREATTIFSVEGFIDDFINFVENTPAGANGFTEKVVRMKSMVFGDMAHVLVLYESHITGSPRPPRQGVDSFSLIKKDGRWWIAAVTNELPTPERPLPEALRS